MELTTAWMFDFRCDVIILCAIGFCLVKGQGCLRKNPYHNLRSCDAVLGIPFLALFCKEGG